MTTFELNIPEQPPKDSVVIDAKGWEWIKDSDDSDWWTDFKYGQRIEWEALLQFGPLTLKEPEPEQGQIKVHRTFPNKFIIFIDGKWQEYHIFSNHTAAKCESEPDLEKFE